MAWEYDGDEEAFWKQNPLPDGYGDYEDSLTYDVTGGSSFLKELMKYYLDRKIDKKGKLALEITEFDEDVLLFISYFQPPELHNGASKIYTEKEIENAKKEWAKRYLLLEQRSKKYIREWYSSSKNFSDKPYKIENDVEDYDLNNDRTQDIYSNSQDKLNDIAIYQNSLIHIFLISTFYIRYDYKSEIKSKLIFKYWKPHKVLSRFDTEEYIENPFAQFIVNSRLKFEGTKRSEKMFKRLAAAHKFLKEKNIHFETNILISYTKDTIDFVEGKYRVSVCLSNDNKNRECIQLIFFEEQSQLFNLKLDFDLLPFAYSRDDRRAENKKRREALRRKYTSNDMIERGKQLIAKYLEFYELAEPDDLPF